MRINKQLETLILTLSLVMGLLGFAQTKGVVKDSITGQPIPYVSVWVENENIGTTAEENGEFTINTNDKNKNLIFSVLGYNRKVCKVSEAKSVVLSPSPYELMDVVIYNKKEKKQLEIGKTKSIIQEAFDNGPRMDAKFFPYLPEYNKTKWIKKVTILTDSKVENATIKLHLYAVDEKGYPGKELLGKDFIVNLQKGIFKHKVDISEFNIQMPQNGIFVAFEKLIIEKNRLEKTIVDYNSNTTRKQITYSPLVLYNSVERDYLFSYSGGKWIRQTKEELNAYSTTRSVYEPNINLILTD